MVTLEQLRQKHKESLNTEKKGNEQSNNFANFKEGTVNAVRILPGKENPLDFFVETHVHKVQIDGKWRNVTCLKDNGSECPLCELGFQLWDRHGALKLPKGTKSKYGTMAAKLKPKPRYYVKAVIRDLVGKEDENGNPENPVKFIAMSKELFDKVMGAVVDPDIFDEADPDNTTILSLENGHDFEIAITKKGEYNSFAESKVKMKKTAAGKPKQVAEWMEDPLDLKSIVKVQTYDEVKLIAQQLLASLENTGDSSEKTPTDDSDAAFEGSLKV